MQFKLIESRPEDADGRVSTPLAPSTAAEWYVLRQRSPRSAAAAPGPVQKRMRFKRRQPRPVSRVIVIVGWIPCLSELTFVGQRAADLPSARTTGPGASRRWDKSVKPVSRWVPCSDLSLERPPKRSLLGWSISVCSGSGRLQRRFDDRGGRRRLRSGIGTSGALAGGSGSASSAAGSAVAGGCDRATGSAPVFVLRGWARWELVSSTRPAGCSGSPQAPPKRPSSQALNRRLAPHPAVPAAHTHEVAAPQPGLEALRLWIRLGPRRPPPGQAAGQDSTGPRQCQIRIRNQSFSGPHIDFQGRLTEPLRKTATMSLLALGPD